MFRYAIFLGVILGLGILPAAAQKKPGAKAAAEKAPEPAPLKATVVSVSGVAQKRLCSDPSGKWGPVRAGDVLNELTIIRTGLGTKVVLRFSDRGDVTIKSGTKTGIASFHKRGKLVTARLGLKYGSLHAKVHRQRGPNDFSVSTPVATLSVRGSEAHIGSWGYALGVNGVVGLWYVDAQGKVRIVQPGESTDQDLTQWDQISQLDGDIVLKDAFGGLTPTELWNLLQNNGGRGVIGGGTGGVVGTLSGGVFTPLDTTGPPQNGNGNGHRCRRGRGRWGGRGHWGKGGGSGRDRWGRGRGNDRGGGAGRDRWDRGGGHGRPGGVGDGPHGPGANNKD